MRRNRGGKATLLLFIDGEFIYDGLPQRRLKILTTPGGVSNRKGRGFHNGISAPFFIPASIPDQAVLGAGACCRLSYVHMVKTIDIQESECLYCRSRMEKGRMGFCG